MCMYYTHVHVGAHSCECMCRGQKRTSGIFLYCVSSSIDFHLILLRQGLSAYSSFSFARLAASKSQQSSYLCSPPPALGLQVQPCPAFYVGVGDLNSGPDTCRAITLFTESPQALLVLFELFRLEHFRLTSANL